MMEKVLVLNYVGNDSFSRPVYENDGKLYVDVEPLSDCEPNICTKMYNHFNGEPDTSLRDMKRYKGVRLNFTRKELCGDKPCISGNIMRIIIVPLSLGWPIVFYAENPVKAKINGLSARP